MNFYVPRGTGDSACPPCECPVAPEQNFLQKYEIVPSVVTGVMVAVITGVVLYQLQRRGVPAA
jgi:hypothetical protein